MSKALERLLARTLDASEGPKARKEAHSRRRTKQRRRVELKTESERRDPAARKAAAAARRVENLARLRDNTESHAESALKTEILSSIARAPPSYVKKSKTTPEFPGVTPGLAPVGYEPDESSDDEPY